MVSIYKGLDPFDKMDLELIFEISEEGFNNLFRRNPLIIKCIWLKNNFIFEEINESITFFNDEISFVIEQLNQYKSLQTTNNHTALLNLLIDTLIEIQHQKKNFYMIN